MFQRPQFFFNVTAVQTFPAHKHALTTQSNGNLFQYDAAGNMTSRKEVSATYQQLWNAENMLVVVTNTTTNYVAKFTYDSVRHATQGNAYNGECTTQTPA